ncbi:uncharacterized protein LOC132752172 isoform X2 [Ruditapes philippinarum]|nr:uncharacterized protein LOC132752172 isoform X2 [Ruditapes philippinarum]XP_060598450.1 uncharacterized protein LOC132752172 isoform X2 [Ruditapes philippinarum]
MNLSQAEEQDSPELFKAFLNLLEQNDELPENILMFGISGAGKSSLINTIHKVLTGKYFELAVTGRGATQTLTKELKRYENCGVKKNWIADSSYKERIVRMIPKFPNLIDFAGLKNENNNNLRDIIELILGGYIPPNITIEALEEIQNKYGMEGLKVQYNKQNPSWKVDRIIVTHGCTDLVPKMLLEALKHVLSLYDSETGKRLYHCRLYLLITKYDQIIDKDQTKRKKTYLHENDCNIETVEKELLETLNMEGAFDSKGQRWVNLTDANKHEDAQVDRDTLIFLKKLVQPIPKQEINHDSRGWQTRLHLKLLYFKQNCPDMLSNFHQVLIFLTIVAIVVAVLSHLADKDPANSAKS